MPAKLKGIIERLEDVAEEYRGLYVKIEAGDKAGKFRLDTDLHDEVAAILANKNELLGEKKKLADQIEQYKDIDPAKAREAMKKLKALDDDAAAASGNWEKLKAQMVEDHQKEVAKFQKQIEELTGSVNHLVVDSEVARLMSSDPELKGAPDLLLASIRGNIRVKKDATSGKWIPEVLKDGVPRVVGTEGRPIALKEYLAECKNDPMLSRAFDGTGSSGGGAPADQQRSAGGGNITITSRAQLKTLDDKVAFIGKHGQEAFEQLPAT